MEIVKTSDLYVLGSFAMIYTCHLYIICFIFLTGTAINQEVKTGSQLSETSDIKHFNQKSRLSNNNQPFLQRAAWSFMRNKDMQIQNLSNLFPKVVNFAQLVKGPSLPSLAVSIGSSPMPKIAVNLECMEANQAAISKSTSGPSLKEEDLDIPWSELILKENIGAGKLNDYENRRTLLLHALATVYHFHTSNIILVYR